MRNIANGITTTQSKSIRNAPQRRLRIREEHATEKSNGILTIAAETRAGVCVGVWGGGVGGGSEAGVNPGIAYHRAGA